jgi:Undecaprenyl-phosphate galactose phosphotransferase WbaP
MAATSMSAGVRQAVVHQCRPGFMTMCLMAGDALSLAIAGAVAILFKLVPTGQLGSWHAYIRLVYLLPVFLLVYAAIGLYSGISLGSPEELRRLTLSSILVSLFLGVLTFSTRGTGTFFTGTMMQALVLSVVLVPLTRVCLRLKLANVAWWGYPTFVFGDPESAETIIRNLLADPGLGLKPVGFVSPSPAGSAIHAVPAIDTLELDRLAHVFHGPAYALLVTCSASQKQLMLEVERFRRYFSHILVVPDFARFSCLWVIPKNLGGMLGLEVCQQVFQPSQRLVKRSIDLILTVIIGILVAPLLLCVAIAIKMNSPGPILYPHRRIGRGGREFRAWKFRSMVANADSILLQCLNQDPESRQEWALNQKLKNDPRVTRVGRFLRRTSLDEFPQLWNVLCGEMSLVGPRPIVREEIARYGIDFETYTWVPSGLTGLWQVSGRSETSYQQRVDYDRFYVLNWSVWLDLCILFRTIGTVLARAGAF